jgi:hypothetical protein
MSFLACKPSLPFFFFIWGIMNDASQVGVPFKAPLPYLLVNNEHSPIKTIDSLLFVMSVDIISKF